MKQIRVLQLVSGVAIGAQSGGAEAHAVHVACLLDRSRFSPAVFGLRRFASEPETAWLHKLGEADVPVYGLTRGGFAPVWRRLWATVSTFQPHVIHSHSERTDVFNALMRVFHPARPRAVRTVHIDRQWKTRPVVGPFLGNTIFPLIFDRESAVSETIRRQLLHARLRPAGEVSLCFNGIDAAAFAGEPASATVSLPGSPPRIGVVGRLTEQKGHTYLLQALALVHKSRPGHLLFIGDGPLRANLKRQAEQLHLTNYVHFLGARNDVWEILPALDVFVLPSLWEGFPTVLLEAMSCNVPAIATDVSGSRHLVRTGETGTLVPPRAPVPLAEAILTVLDNPGRAQEMARQARQLAAQYTIQNTTACYADIYQTVGQT